MRELLNADSIAATIRMLRTAFGGSILLVEGDIDVRLLKRLVDQVVCHVQICYNRSNVLHVVSLLDAGGFVGHLGLIDKDLAELFCEIFESDNIVLTDQNDIELTIFQSDVFDRLIAEYGNPDKIAGLENAKGLSLREALIRSASKVGILRYLSRLRAWNLRFKEMTFRFAVRDDIDIDLELQIEHLRGRSRGTTMPGLDEVKRQIDATERLRLSPLLYVSGHDICEVISKGIHDVFGRAHVALSRGGTAVEEVFRAAFSRENFVATQLFLDIRAWERNHQPYRILSVD